MPARLHAPYKHTPARPGSSTHFPTLLPQEERCPIFDQEASPVQPGCSVMLGIVGGG